MALSRTTNKQTFTAVAGDTQFTFDIAFFDRSSIDEANYKYGDIKLTRESTTGVLTSFVPKTDFTIPPTDGEFRLTATNNDPEQGGTVTISVAATGGEKFTVERDVAYTQQYDLQEGSTIDPTALNKAFDRVVAQNQQQEARLFNSIQFPVTDDPSITYTVGSEVTRANKALGFDASGNVTEIDLVDAGAISGDTNAGISISNNIISAKVDDSTTQFSGGNIAVKTIGTSQLASSAVTTDKLNNNSVTTDKIASDSVTYSQMQNVTAGNSVLGNSAVGTGEVVERSLVGDILLDEDNMATDSNTKGATQQSIKAYIDAIGGSTVAHTNGVANSGTQGSFTLPIKSGESSSIIVKYGTITTTSGGVTGVTFTDAFPNAIITSVVQAMSNPYSGAESATSSDCSQTGVTIRSYSNNSGTGSIRVGWICIGF